MRTSIPNVFAAGDVAVFQDQPRQLWEPAQSQARVAAANMSGHTARYAPGVHYMATRLFDLDFASLGTVETAASAEVLLDFPQGTGRIKYRKLLIQGGALIGVLLLGHREDRVRQGARLFKRLIDSRGDIGRIRAELLNPSFDLRAWLDQQSLVQKEGGLVQAAVAKAAEIRGTSVLDISKLGPNAKGQANGKSTATGAAALGGFGAVGASVTGLPGLSPSKDVQAATMALVTQVLAQFNARAEVGESHTSSTEMIEVRPALLEGAGGRWELKTSLCRIGRSADGDVVLNDPSVEQVHANIQRFTGDWYLRDLGSRTGTSLNGEPLSVPKRLSSRDNIRVGQTELVFHLHGEGDAPQKPARAQRRGPPVPRLQIQSGRSLGLTFALPPSGATLGRDPNCTVWLDDATMAPEHARLQCDQNVWHASGVGAGFWHNQQGVAPGSWIPLNEGDHLTFGAVTVRFTQSPVEEAESGATSDSGGPGPARTSGGQRAGQMPAFTASASPEPQLGQFGGLRIHAGPGAAQLVPLQEYLLIGAAADCHLCLPAKGVAPQHLELRWYQASLWARDLGSATGTVKSGTALPREAVRVAPSDWFSLGPNVTLIFEASR